jgi:hypothetical protein
MVDEDKTSKEGEKRERPKRSSQDWDFINNGGAAYAYYASSKGNDSPLFDGMGLVYSNDRAVSPESQIIWNGAVSFHNAQVAMKAHEKWEKEGKNGSEPQVSVMDGIEHAGHNYQNLIEAAEARTAIFEEAYSGMTVDQIGYQVRSPKKLAEAISPFISGKEGEKISGLEGKAKEAMEEIKGFHVFGNVPREIEANRRIKRLKDLASK